MAAVYAPGVIVVKVIITLIFSIFAALSAKRAVKETTAGKEKISRGGITFILLIGIAIGLIAIVFPVSWMIDIPAIAIFGAMMLMNEEGRYRVASWGSLSLLSGIMLCFGMAAWQDVGIGGIRLWMPITGFLVSLVPIAIGAYRCVMEDIDDYEEKEGGKVKTFLSSHNRVVTAIIGICFIVAVVVSASAWIITSITKAR